MLPAGCTAVLSPSYGEAAALLARGERFDVYLLDLHLGDGHAAGLCALLDEESLRRVLVVTGGAFAEEDHAFLRGVLNPPLTKPFPREKLHEALSSILGGALGPPRSG